MADTHITAGLTAAEWVNWRHPMHEGAYESLYHLKGGADGDHAVMALANHALPEDDPRKITRADVQTLSYVTAMIRDEEPELSNLIALARKLAALLPE